jgi:inorganic pyrophosphatase
MDLSNIKIGDKAPKEINAVIEIPQGSAVKYEIDEKTGALEVDRFISEDLAYPYNYGFIPETLADDGDALDAVVISSLPVEPESVIVCRPIGVLQMEDEHGRDEKILCVPLAEIDVGYSKIKDLNDLDLPTLEKIKLFFAQYKEAEKKRWSKVLSFGDRAAAFKSVEKSREKYQAGQN